MPSSNVLTLDDSIFFSNQSIKEITVNEVRNSKVRSPISFLSYDSLYWVYRYKIALNNNLPLKTILHEENKGVQRTPGITYNIMDNAGYYRFQYAAGLAKPVSQIYFTISADSLVKVKFNDSVLVYHALLHNLSIRYEENHPIDIFVTGANSGIDAETIIPANIVFVKRKQFLYFLLLTPKNNHSSISSDIVEDLIMR